MPRSFNLDEIRLLHAQNSLRRNLKKGDHITVALPDVGQLEQILQTNGIAFISFPTGSNAFLITIT